MTLNKIHDATSLQELEMIAKESNAPIASILLVRKAAVIARKELAEVIKKRVEEVIQLEIPGI